MLVINTIELGTGPLPPPLPPACRSNGRTMSVISPALPFSPPPSCLQIQRLTECNATERERVAFGKSGVNGWGLFARVPLEQDSIVMEYRCGVDPLVRGWGGCSVLVPLEQESLVMDTGAGADPWVRGWGWGWVPGSLEQALMVNGDGVQLRGGAQSLLPACPPARVPACLAGGSVQLSGGGPAVQG